MQPSSASGMVLLAYSRTASKMYVCTMVTIYELAHARLVERGIGFKDVLAVVFAILSLLTLSVLLPGGFHLP